MNPTPQHKHLILSLYRQILKAAVHYPSKNKQGMYTAIKEEFRDHAKETNSKKIETYVDMAKGGLQRLKDYSKAHSNNSIYWG